MFGMKTRLYLLLLGALLLVPELLWAQTLLSGQVRDTSGRGLPFASVRVLHPRDSSLVSGMTTTEQGAYRFDQLPQGSYLVRTSFTGYETEIRRVMLFRSRPVVLDFTLREEGRELRELVVRAQGVRVKGDTTIYSPSFYRKGGERNLGELLETLPGVRVDHEQSTLTINGKPIRKILMESHDIFQGNTAVPLKNLSADGVQSIEVIDNYSEYSILDGFRTSNETVVNLRMDDKMRGRIRGETELLGGLSSKYQLKGNGLLIGRKAMISSILSGNNIGRQVLTTSDVINMNGGLSSIISGENPREAMQRTLSSYQAFLDARSNVYQRDNGLLSLNSSINPSPKIRLQWSGLFGLEAYRLRSRDRYDYLSGLSYEDSMRERQRRRHLMTGLRLSLQPSSLFNLIYSGRLYLGGSRQNLSSSIFSNPLKVRDDDDLLTTEHSLVGIRRIGKHSLNLALESSYTGTKSDYGFSPERPFYSGLMGLPEGYRYAQRQQLQHHTARLSWLHRLSPSYFVRLALGAGYDASCLEASLDPRAQSAEGGSLDQQHWLEHRSLEAGLQLHRDRGALTFTLGARLQRLLPEGKLSRPLPSGRETALLPTLKLNYRLSTTHFALLEHDHALEIYAADQLAGGYRINSYKSLSSSSVDRLYARSSRTMLIHVLMYPLYGFQITNVLSWEQSKHSLVDDYRQQGLVSIIDRRTASGAYSLSWMSALEQKFLFMPLNAKLEGMYMRRHTPYYQTQQLSSLDVDLLRFKGRLTTFYKHGLNADLSVEHLRTAYRNVSVKSEVYSTDYRAALSWRSPKLHAEAALRYRDFRQSSLHTKQIYYDCTLRYELSSKLSFELVGQDILHTNERVQTDIHIGPYLTSTRTMYYMPGHLMLGLKVKY